MNASVVNPAGSTKAVEGSPLRKRSIAETARCMARRSVAVWRCERRVWTSVEDNPLATVESNPIATIASIEPNPDTALNRFFLGGASIIRSWRGP
jgi:hypothetical protein